MIRFIFSALVISLFTFTGLQAQTSPLDPVCTFNWQGVIRNTNDAVLPNQAIKVQFTILDGPGGNELYIEQHDATTTSLGLANLEIGAGDIMGGSMAFEFIPWSIRRHFLRVEVDPAGGINFITLGESPILAVPIAVHAKVAAFAVTTLDTITRFDTLTAKQICVDSIKAKVACLDTIKAVIGLIDTISAYEVWSPKVFSQDICLADNDGNARSVLRIDTLFGFTESNVDKANVSSICFIDPITEENVGGLGVNIIGQTILDVDRIEGCTVMDSLKTENYIQLISTDGELAGVLGVDEDGVSGIDVEIVLAQNIETDTLGANVICADTIKTNTFCSFDNFEVKNLFGDPVFTVEPNADIDYAFNLVGNVMIQGGLAAEFKQFLIDHPLDPENRYLRHFSIESDQMTNMYNGTVELNEEGQAMVQLPDWMESLNTDFSYQLTCVGGFANVYIAEEIIDNRFRIAGGQAGLKVSWQVSGVRHDPQAMEQNLPTEGWKE